MKKILLSILAFCGLAAAKAQNEIMTAVLHHGSDMSVFTGANAFVNANAAAADGDVIMLSSGSFNVSNITKSITIYGAGFEKDDANGVEVTKFNSQLNIGVSGGDTLKDIRLEGIYFNSTVNAQAALKGFVLEKCYVNGNVNLIENTNTTIVNCVVNSDINGNNKTAANCIIQNCHVKGTINTFEAGSSVKIDHCITSSWVGPYTCTNSIFAQFGRYGEAAFANTQGAIVKNCIFRDNNSNNASNNDFQNCYTDNITEIFADAELATYSATRTFEIKQPTTWIGTDGQEIGIRYGWSKTPKTPAVKNLTTTVSGESLNVNYDAMTR